MHTATAISVAEHFPIVGDLGLFVTVCALSAYAIKFVRVVARFFRKANRTLDDFQGEPARPGFQARPGILERQAVTEERQRTIITQITAIQEQMNPNSGHSLRDQTNRIEAKLDEHLAAVARGETT